MAEKKIYTTAEAAEKTGLKPVSIRVAIREGRLPAEKAGRDWLIRTEDLEAFAAMDRKRGRKKKN